MDNQERHSQSEISGKPLRNAGAFLFLLWNIVRVREAEGEG